MLNRRSQTRLTLTASLLTVALSACGQTTVPQSAAPSLRPLAPSTSNCRYVASAPTVVLAAPPSGFSGAFTDNGLAIAPTGSGLFKFIGTDFHYLYGGEFSGTLTGTLDAPASAGTATGVLMSGVNRSGGYDNRANNRRYAAVSGKVYVVAADFWIASYHSEQDQADGSFYSRVGLAKSTDQGASWSNLGEIITPNVGYNPNGSVSPIMNQTTFEIVNDGGTDYMYVYISEQGVGTLAVARATLGAVVAAAQNNSVPEFNKYADGAWNQAGLGGRASSLADDTVNIGGMDLLYSLGASRFVAVGRGSGPNIPGDSAQLIDSTDGVNWSSAQTLFTEPGLSYFSLTSTAGDAFLAGDNFYVYYGVQPGSGPWRIERRTVTCGAPGSGGELLVDPGFEQSSGAPSSSWTHGGTGAFGLDEGVGKAHTGRNNAWLAGTSPAWNALDQQVAVTPNTDYTLSAWVRTSGNFGENGYLGVAGNGLKVETTYGSTGAYDSGYQPVSVEVNSGNNTSLTVYIGLANAAASGSWVQIDDVSLTPR